MDGINSVTISGNICRDPEVRATQSGLTVVTLSMAVNESHKVGDQYEDYANFFTIVGFGQRWETMVNKGMLAKGTKAMVHGKLRYSSWEKDGQKRSKVEIIADSIDLAGRRQTQSEPEQAIYDDDIPF